MPLMQTLPVGPDTAQWSVWSTTARLVVTDPARLPAAQAIVEASLAAVDRACSRFRADSELRLVSRAAGQPVRVSPLFAELVGVALEAANRTGGDVDPTVGSAMIGLGYDRDFAQLPASSPGASVVVAAPGWQRVELRDRELRVPAGVELDLGATAKAFTADLCARRVANLCDVGVLVSLGGDIATAGPAPCGGWRVRVQDRPEDPRTTVTLPGGAALATSSSVSRQWRRGGQTLHHILDPRTGRPVSPVWRTVSVAAWRCLDANVVSTAAVVRGVRATRWLRDVGLQARLVTRGAHEIITLNGWPADGQVP
jgi:thiamine biosynthesis lipoprotein